LREKYPHKQELDIQHMMAGIKKGYIDEWVCNKVLEKMYDEPDQEVLAKMFAKQ